MSDDTAAVLAEVLERLGRLAGADTDDDSDYDRGFGDGLTTAVRWLEAALATSGAPDTVAAVLVGLVEEMRTRAEQYDVQGTANTDLVAFGIARAINIVEAAQQRQATSGARAGSGSGETDDEAIERAVNAAFHRGWAWGKLEEGDREEWRRLAHAFLAHAPPTSGARAAGEPPARVWWSDELGWIWGFDGRYEADDWSSRWQIAELPSDAVELLPAAPPTPSAPGVAALLAECARRQETYGDKWISIWQIVRLLAPEGADEEGEGT